MLLLAARRWLVSFTICFTTLANACDAAIDRHGIVSRYNPSRNASSPTTPMQVGNGNFAFGADVTGLQTFLPWAIMSSWGWKNDTLPPDRTWQDILDYQGISWWNHNRLVTYDFDGPADLQQWLISNPNRVNLANIGLSFWSADGTLQNITEADLTDINQTLDLWSGIITSNFSWDGHSISVQTSSHQSLDTIGVVITSDLLSTAQLRVFLDFPWNDGSEKFEAPFVGYWNLTTNHTTRLSVDLQPGSSVRAQITHQEVANVFHTSLGGDEFTISRDSPETHRYTVIPNNQSSSFSLSALFGLSDAVTYIPSSREVVGSSRKTWQEYWTKSGFVDVFTDSTDSRADEIQRRIILSRYLMRVNEAGDYPPQESGLVNTGWYGKFHLEMFFWHSCHWSLWNNWDLAHRSSSVYERFLPTSITRAQVQEHWDTGARWGKMSDPSGRSAPGDINELLIWQQPHPLVFAEYEYRAFPTATTLEKWRDVVWNTAAWMADFAWWNESTGVYDIGPPMYVVAEDTSPNVTVNPAFELSYWWYGLNLSKTWMTRLGEDIPSPWTDVQSNLAPLPLHNGTYQVYEGIETDFWFDPTYINDHPSLVGLYGWLPQTPKVNLTIAENTALQVWATWNISNCWGWDFPMLAMSAARSGDAEKAVEWLLHPLFQFDDVGMPIGGVRVPTPYFPAAGGLLYAIALMANGWDGSENIGPGFPKDGWIIKVEGVSTAL